MSSSSSVVEISRSKKRYQDQDALLKGFVGCDGFTAKEVAVEVLDWKYESYANAPKRAWDLQAFGYVKLLEGRKCRQTGKVAHTYRITDKGMAYLRDKGINYQSSAGVVVPAPIVAPAYNPIVDVRQAIGRLKSLLSDG